MTEHMKQTLKAGSGKPQKSVWYVDTEVPCFRRLTVVLWGLVSCYIFPCYILVFLSFMKQQHICMIGEGTLSLGKNN